MTAVLEKVTGRSLISADLFNRLVSRIVKDEGYEREVAERIMDQALVFLATCAQEHTEPLAPSELVDIGWHTFILHTRDYADFCQRVAGRFIHHVPNDGEGNEDGLVRHTIERLTALGAQVDPDLWGIRAGDCHQCHAGCDDSPNGGGGGK